MRPVKKSFRSALLLVALFLTATILVVISSSSVGAHIAPEISENFTIVAQQSSDSVSQRERHPCVYTFKYVRIEEGQIIEEKESVTQEIRTYPDAISHAQTATTSFGGSWEVVYVSELRKIGGNSVKTLVAKVISENKDSPERINEPYHMCGK